VFWTTKLMDVKLPTADCPVAGVIEMWRSLKLWLAASVLLMLSGWSYVRVALGYALRAKLTHVELVPIVDPLGQSFPVANTIVALVIVTVGCIIIE